MDCNHINVIVDFSHEPGVSVFGLFASSSSMQGLYELSWHPRMHCTFGSFFCLLPFYDSASKNPSIDSTLDSLGVPEALIHSRLTAAEWWREWCGWVYHLNGQLAIFWDQPRALLCVGILVICIPPYAIFKCSTYSRKNTLGVNSLCSHAWSLVTVPLSHFYRSE